MYLELKSQVKVGDAYLEIKVEMEATGVNKSVEDRSFQCHGRAVLRE